MTAEGIRAGVPGLEPSPRPSLLGAGNAEMMFQTFDSLRCLGAAIKFISCTVNLFSLSMEEVTNVHKIEVQVITSRSESILTALPCAGVLWELLFL